MNESELLAMRGVLDITLAIWLVNRFLSHAAIVPGWRSLWLQITTCTVILLLLQMLGVWSWQEIRAALKLIPIIWPLLIVVAYFAYQLRRLNRQLHKAEFEVDWRREYQEVLMEQLEKEGRPAPPPPNQN